LYNTSDTDLAVFKIRVRPHHNNHSWEQAVVLDDQDVLNLNSDLDTFYEKLYADTGCNFNDGKWSLFLLDGPHIDRKIKI